MNCDCLDENCEVDDWSEQQLHDCSFIEDLFQNIPVHILTNMYDAVQFVTTLEVKESNSTLFDQNQHSFNNSASTPTPTSNETTITIKIARKLDMEQTMDNLNKFIEKYPEGFTEATWRNDDEHIYCDADTGQVKPFPATKGIYVEYSDDSEEDTTFDKNYKSKRRKLLEAENRKLALRKKGISVIDGVAMTGEWTKKFARHTVYQIDSNDEPLDDDVEGFENEKDRRKNKRIKSKYDNMTEEDLPKHIQPPKTEETGQTAEDLDELIRTFYFDRLNYQEVVYIKGFNKQFPNRTAKLYQCPYKHCDFKQCDYGNVLKHIETGHFEDPDIETLTPLEWGLKNLYRTASGRGTRSQDKNPKYKPVDNIWRCPYPNCDHQAKKIASVRHHVESVHNEIRYPCPNEGCEQVFANKKYLNDHVRNVHENIKVYQCDLCEQHYKTSYSLRCHRMIHTGERRFTCPGCGKGFIQSTPWKRHMANVCRVQPPDKKSI